MIREFIKSKSKRTLFSSQMWSRINFTTSCYGILVLTKILGQICGTVYDQELLKYIRENALPISMGMRLGDNPSLTGSSSIHEARTEKRTTAAFCEKPVGEDR